MGWTSEESGLDSRQRQEIFLFPIASRQALKPTQPPIQWESGAVFPPVKRDRRESDRSLASNAEFKSGGAISPFPHMPSWYSA
jgi:hypothetical protein